MLTINNYAGQTIMKGFVNLSIPVNIRSLITMMPALVIIALLIYLTFTGKA